MIYSLRVFLGLAPVPRRRSEGGGSEPATARRGLRSSRSDASDLASRPRAALSKPFLCAWLCVIALVGALTSGGSLRAQQHAEPHPPAAMGTPAHPVGQHEEKSTLDMSIVEIFNALHGHSVPHVVMRPQVSPDPAVNRWFEIYNVNVWQWVALGLMFVLFMAVRFSFDKSGRPSWIVRVFRGWCRWIRDEMVYGVMGKEEGRAFAPFFIFVFFFVCFMNVMGLVPSIGHWLPTATATGTPYVTGPLALITLLLMLFFGMKKNGVVGFWKGLLPHGLPVAMIPLMVVVELTGLIVKPFALTVRLFANMLAGHLVIVSVIGLIFVFTKMFVGAGWSANLAYLPAIPAILMATFVFIIESFVTLLQAYIFTYLSIIFLHQAMHQSH